MVQEILDESARQRRLALVARVKKALDKYQYRENLGDLYAAKKIFHHQGKTYVHLDLSGRWSVIHAGLTVQLFGYNIFGNVCGWGPAALEATYALAAFKLISDEEATAFREWYGEEESRLQTEAGLKSIAMKLGYDLKKKRNQ